MEEPAPPAPPALRVVRGDPTPDELAALTAVVLARGAALSAVGEPVAGPPPVPGWLRPSLHRPAGAWRTFPR
ncbi:acyl-CoA carboxylase subunit epsilon [Streptomyces sp. NPDC052016]|uniref:acyl-CoA carboxylase subunit epsilon n=1 Tax=Streptomyces sp. NPDC052016 TaxID=3365680 RepID=UPI0037D1DF7C